MYKNIKKAVLLMLLLFYAVSASSCASSKASMQGSEPNEILTFQEIPKSKLLITLRTQDGIDTAKLVKVIEAQFPEVAIVPIHNTPDSQALQYQDCEDIYLSTFPDGADTEELQKTFLDLSAEPFVSNYYLSSLNECEADGRLYYLPGPSNIYGIVYNRELFTRNGWEVPRTLDEFITLCQTIEDTGIRALQPSLYYSDSINIFFSGFTYSAVFAGLKNYAWLQDYRAGEADMKGHMEPAFDILQKLMDAEIWSAQDFNVQPATRSQMLYAKQSCAMIVEGQLAPVYAESYSETRAPALGMMPFFSGNEEDSDYLLSVPIYYMALNKELAEPGSEEKLQAAKEIAAYLSSKEGQLALIDQKSPLLSSVKGVEIPDTPFLSSVTPTIEKGHVFPLPYLFFKNTNAVDKELQRDLKAFAQGQITAAEIMKCCDRKRDQILFSHKGTQLEVIGTAETDFTVMELSSYMADVFRQKTGADIGLCQTNTRFNGINFKLYSGEIEIGGEHTIDTLLNQNYNEANSDENGGRLITVQMTGENLLKSLNQPVGLNDAYPAVYFTASGLSIEFAPWAGSGRRIIKAELSDGSPLKPDQMYRVAVWSNTINPSLISSVSQTYEDSLTDLFSDAVRTAGTIRPFQDGRFLINWSIKTPVK